jgi:hypothetical protein
MEVVASARMIGKDIRSEARNVVQNWGTKMGYFVARSHVGPGSS